MRGTAFLLASFVVVSSCGGKIGDGTDAGGDASTEVSTNGQCCPISPNPSCCMSFGGYTEGAPCAQVCDGMPEPNEPGWHQSADSHGCPIWVPPSNAASYCGAPPPPIDAGGACTPADVTSWAPQIDPPFYGHADVCTLQQLQDIYVACFANADPKTCQQVSQQYASCAQCLMTPETAAKWGALLTLQNGILELDIPGCIAVTSGDASPTSCAQKQSDAMQCGETACASCVVTDQQSAQDYQSCIQAADATGCNKFAAAECAIDGGALAACFPADFKSGFFTFGPLFCGP